MKWIRKQIAALVLGFLDSEKELRSTSRSNKCVEYCYGVYFYEILEIFLILK